MATDSGPDKLYAWLLIDSDLNITRMEFKGMRSDGNVECRDFEQGSLKFDSLKAELHHVDYGMIAFERVSELNESFDHTVLKYLSDT